jgi:hypothetical protein
MKNKHIEVVKKYLNDPKSVTIEELEVNKKWACIAADDAADDAAYAAAVAAYVAAYDAAYAAVAAVAVATVATVAYDAAYAAAAHAAADAGYKCCLYADAAAYYVKRYEDLVK